MSNKEFRTEEVFERSKAIFFTSIFCGSAVHILDVLIADSGIFDGPGFFAPLSPCLPMLCVTLRYSFLSGIRFALLNLPPIQFRGLATEMHEITELI